MQRKAKGVALCAVLFALTIVFGAIPYAFLIPVLVASVTTDLKTSLITSTFFGCVSLVYSLMGGSIVAAAFVAQPWIPIVGRIFVGPLAFGAYKLANKLIKKDGKLKKILPPAAAATVGSLANTAFVVSLLVLCMPTFELGDTTILVYATTMLISGAIELAVNNVILVPLSFALSKIPFFARTEQTKHKERESAETDPETAKISANDTSAQSAEEQGD